MLSTAVTIHSKGLGVLVTPLMLVDSAVRHGISVDHRSCNQSHNQLPSEGPNQGRLIIHQAETPLVVGPSMQELIYTKATFNSRRSLFRDLDQETEVLWDLKKSLGGRLTRKTTLTRVANKVSVIFLLIRTRGHPQISVVTRPEAISALIGTGENSLKSRKKIRPLRVCRILSGDRSSFSLRGGSPQTGSSS